MSPDPSALTGETLITRLRERFQSGMPSLALLNEAADTLSALTARVSELKQERDAIEGWAREDERTLTARVTALEQERDEALKRAFHLEMSTFGKAKEWEETAMAAAHAGELLKLDLLLMQERAETAETALVSLRTHHEKPV